MIKCVERYLLLFLSILVGRPGFRSGISWDCWKGTVLNI